MSLDIENYCITVISLSKFACLVGCYKTVLRTSLVSCISDIPKCIAYMEQVMFLRMINWMHHFVHISFLIGAAAAA